MNEVTISSTDKKVELSLEVESLAFTAAIFRVRYIPTFFYKQIAVRSSDIVSTVNNLQFGNSENFNIDMRSLHYAIDYFSVYFQSLSDISLTKTWIKNYVVESLEGSKVFLAKTSGWEVCFKEHDYCSAE